MRIRAGLVWACMYCLPFGTVGAQTANTSDILARATALSSSGDYAGVVRLLDAYVEEHPAHAEPWLLLAQHRYWNKDADGARDTYKKALRLHPESAPVRLGYARFLLENGHEETAVDVLQPIGPDNAVAEVIRGKAAWWSGDLTSAARHFRNALATAPDHSEAASSLAAILKEARPWLRVVGERMSDSQPLSQSGLSAEGGIFLTPLQTLKAEATRSTFTVHDAAVPVTSARLNSRGYWPGLKMDSDVSVGLIGRSDSATWTARVDARFRLPFGFRLGARWERTPYLHTVASMTKSVMTTGAQGRLSFDREGWLGEIVVGRENYPDDNDKTLSYAWVMAPLFRAPVLTLQAGYAFHYQDTEEHRFTAVLTAAPRPGQLPAWEGRYDPYYTPLKVTTHSVTTSIALRPGDMLTVGASGAYAIAGSEQAPYLYLIGRAPVTDVYIHNIHPWNIRASISRSLSQSLSIHFEASHMATAWYDASTLNATVYVRL